MNDGGGESGKENEYNLTKNNNKHGNDEYAQSIARIAVAQVCESVGFQGFQQSALDTLSDIACRYIIDIGKTANLYANIAGRTESNVFDIIQGLEDLGLAQGFSGASDINRSLSSSGVIKDVSQYIGVEEEIAFAYSIPRFPVIKEREPRQSFLQAGVSPPSEHIPPWLPCFPDPETYTGLPLSSMKEAKIMADKVVEQPVASLQQRLTCNRSELPDAAVKDRVVDSNPFLAAPLQFGEKEVASVGPPPKFYGECDEKNRGVGLNPVSKLDENSGSMLEAFRPAIEAMKKGILDSEEGSRTFIKNNRPAVQLKFRMHKKFIDTSSGHREKGVTGLTSWFENDAVKNDKKRRAEQILRDSMDIGQPKKNDSFVD